MSLVLTAFTERGIALACRLAEWMGEGQVWVPERFAGADVSAYESLSVWTAAQFARKNDLIFVSAAGIAVRAIAPYVHDKLTDPAVLSIDEGGRFVVPLLSGHVGGGNRLARRVAKLLNATPVISTATDINGLFAVDEWAVSQGMTVTDRQGAKAVSAALLAGEPVGFFSELPHEALPEGVTEGQFAPGFAVTCRTGKELPQGMLILHPRLLTVGIGCKKKLPPEQVGETVKAVLSENDFSEKSVFSIASIDLKREDEGIRLLSEQWEVPCHFFAAEQLRQVAGEFTPSNFVHSVTGVDNVCERSAVLAAHGGRLLVRKTARNGVTVAVAQRVITLQFQPKEPEG